MIKLNNKEMVIVYLKELSKKFPNLEINELMKFYFVFDGIEINNNYDNVFDAIKNEILLNFDELMLRYDIDSNSKLALIKFAKNDRKKLSVNKILPRFQGQKAVNLLLKRGFLELEKSREQKPTRKRKNEKLPKNLRRYIIHDKVRFKNHFDRFWFRFIEPNLSLLKDKKLDEVLKIIKDDFENYSSLGFEILSSELLKKYLNLHEDIYSFWNKEFEIDIFCEFDGGIIVGEVKYKDRKVCKSLLSLLSAKCDKLTIEPNIIALFSKSGFSKELLGLKCDKLLLFDIKDFKLLLE